jgi:hypothetical protein
MKIEFTRAELVHIRACVRKMHQDAIYGGDTPFSAPENALALGESGINNILRKTEEATFGDRKQVIEHVSNMLQDMLPNCRIEEYVREDRTFIRIMSSSVPVSFAIQVEITDRDAILYYDVYEEAREGEFRISDPAFPGNLISAVKSTLNRTRKEVLHVTGGAS